MPKPKHISQAAWDKAQELLKTAPDKWCNSSYSTNTVCAGAYIEKDGKISSNYLEGYVCHAYVQRDYNNRHLHFNTIKNIYDNKEAFEAFCRWMKDKSPVRKFILNENYESMYHGGIIIDCTRCPSAALLWICKAFRAAYEDTWRIPIWYELVNEGVHPMLAMCYSQCVTANWADYGSTTHGSCMAPPTTKEHMKRLFIDHIEQKKPDPNEVEVDDDYDEDDYYWEGSKWDTPSVFRPGVASYRWSPNIFYLPDKGKKQKVPDGWGGYIEKAVKLDAKEVAKELKKLEKEYK
jgi:hypothetical protein